MRNLKFLVLTLGLALTVTACARRRRLTSMPPAAMDSAVAAGAAEYAAPAMKAVEDAQAALDAELKPGRNWLKSYTKAKELAAAVKTAGEKAAADAATGKETAKNEPPAAIGEVKTLLTDAQALLDKRRRARAPRLTSRR